MKRLGMRARPVAAIVVAVCGYVVAGGAAQATAPATPVWNTPALLLPSGTTIPESGFPDPNARVVSSPAGATFLYFLQNGYPALAQYNANGTRGTPVPVPASPTYGGEGADQVEALGPIQFLPNGDAIVSWSPAGGQTFAYRSANGTWGTAMDVINPDYQLGRPGRGAARHPGQRGQRHRPELHDRSERRVHGERHLGDDLQRHRELGLLPRRPHRARPRRAGRRPHLRQRGGA